LLPQIEDLSFASGLRATQPRQQRRKILEHGPFGQKLSRLEGD
jgi:hypothetical protein